MLQKRTAAVTDVAIFLPCCCEKQGFEVKPDKNLFYKQDLKEGRLDDVIYFKVKCTKCGSEHRAELCRLGFLPKEFVNGMS